MTHFSSDADVLDYFKISQRRAITVTWDHAVNSRAHLEKALAGIPYEIMRQKYRISIELYSKCYCGTTQYFV